MPPPEAQRDMGVLVLVTANFARECVAIVLILAERAVKRALHSNDSTSICHKFLETKKTLSKGTNAVRQTNLIDRNTHFVERAPLHCGVFRFE